MIQAVMLLFSEVFTLLFIETLFISVLILLGDILNAHSFYISFERKE